MHSGLRWWRAAAGVLLAGGAGVFLPPDRPAAAQPKADATWTRSASPLAPAAYSAAGPGRVIPAGATMPQPTLPPLPPVPGIPALPPPVVTPPDAKTLPLPPLPVAVPPAAPVAPPAPPAKSVFPPQPAEPAKADSPLRAPDAGNNVKTDAAWKASTTAREATAAEPPVARPRPADRAKAPQGPVPPSERDEFPLPAAPPPLAAPPAATPPTPGADPMTFKTTAAAVLGGAMMLAPAATARPDPADGQAKDAAKTPDQRLTQIESDLRRVLDHIDGRKDDKGVPLPSDPGLRADVSKLRDEVAALKTQMEQLKASTSLRPPGGAGTVPGVPNQMPGPAAAADPAAKGTVRVVNEYPVEITMVVNARSHRVSPTTTVDIPIPAGDFSYQLLSANTALAPTRSTIRANEVVTLRIK